MLGAIALVLAAPDAGQAQGGTALGAWRPDEAEAVALYRSDELLSARTAADEILKRYPDSIAAHFVLGAVLHEAEGSLARAMYHLGRARELFETQSHSQGAPGSTSDFHRELLFKLQNLAGELELNEYRIQILGYHDYLYDPDLLAEQAWALIPLGRLKEARALANRAKASRDRFEQSSGLNALCAIEGEAGNRAAYAHACEAALTHAERRANGAAAAHRGAPETGTTTEDSALGLAVHAYNAALSAQTSFRFEHAEALALRGTHRLEITPANPWRLVASLRLNQGKLTEAVEALREMNRWRRRQPAYLRDQARAETDVTLATVLLVAGQTSEGLTMVSRALKEPDRRGLTSSSREQALGAHALLHRALLLQARAEAEEEACFDGWFSCLVHPLLRFFSGAADLFEDEEQVRAVLSDSTRLRRTFRAYAKGGLDPLPPWLAQDLVMVLGAGVAATALAEARESEIEVQHSGTAPAGGPAQGTSAQTASLAKLAAAYRMALQAEIDAVAGRDVDTLSRVETALRELPATEVLLRSRLAAIAARAAYDLGRDRDAVRWLTEVVNTEGSVLRRLGLKLPVTFRVATDGGPSDATAREVAAMLERSPRFRHDRGFVVQVSSSNDSVRVCLLSPMQQQLRCESIEPGRLRKQFEADTKVFEKALAAWRRAREGPAPKAPEAPDPARVLARSVHRTIFSAPVKLSSADLQSLDGRTTTGAEVARERLEGLLDAARTPPP